MKSNEGRDGGSEGRREVKEGNPLSSYWDVNWTQKRM